MPRYILGDSGRLLTPQSAIGIDNLPNQLARNKCASGFVLNLLVAGETAVGKSTLINTLLHRNLDDTPHPHHDSAADTEATTYDLEEGGVKLKLTIISTVGIGDQVDQEHNATPLLDYIDAQFDAHIEDELQTERDLSRTDTRVHACIYLLPPTGRDLKRSDIGIMSKLQNKVNLIPVVAKADTITTEDLEAFKKRVVVALEENGIKWYKPTDYEAYDDAFPAATIASNEVAEVDGETVRVRKYPWGTVEVEENPHSDVGLLRALLFRTHTHELVSRTHADIYEQFRALKLKKMGFVDADEQGNPISLIDTLYLVDLNRKHAELDKRFLEKIRQKESELDRAKDDLLSKYGRLTSAFSADEKRIDGMMQALEADREEWLANRDE